MDKKPVEALILGGRRGGAGGGGEMKRIPPELALEQLFSKEEKVSGEIRTQRARVFAVADVLLSLDEEPPKSLAEVCADGDLTSPFRNRVLLREEKDD